MATIQSVAMRGGTLLQRFEEFVQTLDGYESVDELLRNCDVHGRKRADYLLANRSIIVEQKVLKSDPHDKPQKYIEKLVGQGKLLFWGTRSTDSIFRDMKDGQLHKKELFDYLTKAVCADIEKADKQTRDTRDIFDVPDAMGVVVLLNEAAQTLVPDTIRYAIEKIYLKRTKDGARRYTSNTGFILLGELHSVAAGGMRLNPMPTFVDGQSPHADRFTAFKDDLLQRWAAFNGVPLENVPMDKMLQAR